MTLGRIAGDDPGYTFRLCRVLPVPQEELTGEDILAGTAKRKLLPLGYGFELPSVSTFLGDVMGKPAGAMSWWGYRVALGGVAEVLGKDPDAVIDSVGDAEALEALIREHGVDPNTSTALAGDRGDEAHGVLEDLVESLQNPDALKRAIERAERETAEFGTEYGHGVLQFWHDEIEPNLLSKQIPEGLAIRNVLSEVPVWSFDLLFAGSFDLGIEWVRTDEQGDVDEVVGWEIDDLKTHKPAAGFTKPGKGPGYVSEAAQNRAYRIGFEECAGHPLFERWRRETGVEFGAKTIGQRTIVVRDKAYRKVRWLEDRREVSENFVRLIRGAFDEKTTFEKGDD